jgi:hypothetical protein
MCHRPLSLITLVMASVHLPTTSGTRAERASIQSVQTIQLKLTDGNRGMANGLDFSRLAIPSAGMKM